MKEKISNFSYLECTELEKVYEKIIKAEYTCDDFPDVCKITIRMVLEEFLRIIAYRYSIDSEVETGVIIKGLKKEIPDGIYKSIQVIRMNGIGMTLYKNRDEYKDKQPLELLNMIHKIFCWYLIMTTKDEKYNIPFKAPNKMEFDEHELKKIKDDVSLKDNQISNLRQKILDSSNKSKNISELNRIIIAIKNEKINQEKILNEVKDYVNIHKRIIHEIAAEKESIIKRFTQLKISCKSAHEDLAQKESQIVRAELDYQKIKKIINNLDERNSLVEDKIKNIEKVLEFLRDKYEKILELYNKRQDLIESIEFTENLNIKNKLSHKKMILDNELSDEEKYFSQSLSNYLSKIQEIEGKIKVFKEILNDRIKSELKNKEFYKSFLNLQDINLRVLYSFVKCHSNYNIVNKSRDLLSKYKICQDTFREELNKSLESLKNISDDQIKIILYYDLLRIVKIPAQPIYKRAEFINMYDKIIDSVYNILMSKKEFNYAHDKITSIKIFYLKRFILELDKRHKVQLLDNELVQKIYYYILMINDRPEIIVPEKYNLEKLSVEQIENNIRKRPFEALHIISNFIDSKEVMRIYDLILEILKRFNEENIFGSFDIHVSLDKFLKGPYRIYLFLNSDSTILKDSEEVLSIIVSEVLVGNLNNDEDVDYFEKYNELVKIWRKNQQIYSDLSITRQGLISDISKKGIEKVELQIKLKNMLQHKSDLKYASEKVNSEFEEIVLKSRYAINLPSYNKYRESIEKAEQHSNIDNKTSFIIGNIMDKVSKKIKDFTSEEIKKTLVKEGKNSSYFENEYKEIENIENNILHVEKEIINNKNYIKEKDIEITELNNKKNVVEKKMVSIKKLYLDIHEE